MKTEPIGTLSQLEGVKKKNIPCFSIKNPSSVKTKKMKDGYAYTTAGDNGAINVWIDDKGFYRAELMVYCIVKDKVIFKTLKETRLWIKEALIKIA